MTPVDKVFMLEASTKLTFDAMLEIYKSGYARIPVYDGTVSKDRVISVLYVKDLILVDPDDEIEVQTVVSFRCSLSPNPLSLHLLLMFLDVQRVTFTSWC